MNSNPVVQKFTPRSTLEETKKILRYWHAMPTAVLLRGATSVTDGWMGRTGLTHMAEHYEVSEGESSDVCSGMRS